MSFAFVMMLNKTEKMSGYKTHANCSINSLIRDFFYIHSNDLNSKGYQWSKYERIRYDWNEAPIIFWEKQIIWSYIQNYPLDYYWIVFISFDTFLNIHFFTEPIFLRIVQRAWKKIKKD